MQEPKPHSNDSHSLPVRLGPTTTSVAPALAQRQRARSAEMAVTRSARWSFNGPPGELGPGGAKPSRYVNPSQYSKLLPFLLLLAFALLLGAGRADDPGDDDQDR